VARVERVALALLCAAVVAPTQAEAAERFRPAELPGAGSALSPEPPLASTSPTLLELRLPGGVESSQRISAEVAPDGQVLRVVVRQRLVVRGRGDYSFAIAAPVTDVAAAPDSESEPGLRRGAVLWQGFSSGGRVLAADMRLETAAAAPLLPLVVRLERVGPRRFRLTIANRTRIRVTSYRAEAVPSLVATALDATRADLRRNRVAPPRQILVRPQIAATTRVVGAPFAIDAAVVLPAGTRLADHAATGLRATGSERRLSLRGIVRGGTAATAELRLAGRASGLPSVRVVARPVVPPRVLAPPAGRSWRAWLRRQSTEPNRRALLARALDATLTIARTTQYGRFVAAPSTATRPDATYVYRVRVAAAPAPRAPSGGGDGSSLVPLLVLGGLALGVLAGTIAWAHS